MEETYVSETPEHKLSHGPSSWWGMRFEWGTCANYAQSQLAYGHQSGSKLLQLRDLLVLTFGNGQLVVLQVSKSRMVHSIKRGSYAVGKLALNPQKALLHARCTVTRRFALHERHALS